MKIKKNNTGKIITLLLVIGVSILFFFIGYKSKSSSNPIQKKSTLSEIKTQKHTIWTCSMHPQIRLPKPGKCPICGMTLIPLKDDDGNSTNSVLKMSEYSRKLSEIETSVVKKMKVNPIVDITGKIEYDETKLKYISSWVAGRIDRLYVDFTGTRVNKGEHLVYLYSPEIISAQKELIESIKAYKRLKNSNLKSIKETAELTLKSVKEKLRLLGLTRNQINSVEKLGKTSDHITIYSPISGIVIEKNAKEGMYVKVGTKIYMIADLSQVWIWLDAYESDIEWLNYGQMVEFEVEAYPGKKFKGRISFISPVLDEKTRTIKVRVIADNKQLKLKPGMFVHAVINTGSYENTNNLKEKYNNKYVCPMHPEIIRNAKGYCPKCHMRLISTKSIGINFKNNLEYTVVPKTAVLITGKRAIVYVEKKPGEFQYREIILGPKANNYYVVKKGLSQGEKVVTNGNFKIDSSMQILGKSSMMNGNKDKKNNMSKMTNMIGMDHSKMKSMIPLISKKRPDFTKKYFEYYIKLTKNLSSDNFEVSNKIVLQMKKYVIKFKHDKDLSKIVNKIISSLKQLEISKTINKFREKFVLLSNDSVELGKQFGTGSKLYKAYCPMVKAPWLQEGKDIKNPYFGSKMLKCGSIKEELR